MKLNLIKRDGGNRPDEVQQPICLGANSATVTLQDEEAQTS